MTQAAGIRLGVTDLAYEQTPVGGQLLADLGAGRVADDYPLLDVSAPAMRADSPFVDRAALAERLASTNAALGNALSEATVRAIATDGRLVITGQQPGLLLGPMYTLLKAVTAVSLAERLAERSDVPIVPAFWIASEDHDIEEVNRCEIGGRTFACDHEELHRGGSRPPVGWLSLEPWRDAIIEFVASTLPAGAAKDATLDMLGGLDWSSYTAAFAQLMGQLVGRGELVLIDPMRLRELTAPALAHVVERYGEVSEAFDAGTRRVREAGYDPPLERMGLFELVDGRRVACEMQAGLAERIRNDPERYSPNAALRPMVQDMALPTTAAIGGPGEMLYLWQIDPMYRALGVGRSRLWPRISATILDERSRRRAEAFGLTGAKLFKAATLAERFDPGRFDVEDADVREIEALRDQLVEKIESLDGEADGKVIGKATDSIRHQVDKLADRVRNERLSRRGLGKGELKQLATIVMPHGKPAERVISPIDYVGRHGVGLVEQLVGGVDPTVIGHRIIEVHAS